MNDMTPIIAAKSDQINATDLIAAPRTIRIDGVTVKPDTEQPVSIAIAGDRKVYRPCKSMSRVLVAAWGPDTSKYTGRSLTLYCDPKVKWGGLEVGGIRISAMSDINGVMTMALAESKAVRRPFTVKPLQVEAPQSTASTGYSLDADLPDAPDDENRTEAAGWVDRAILAINGAPYRAALATVQTKRAKTLADVRAAYPDLAERVDAAMTAKLAAFDDDAGDGAGEERQAGFGG